MATDAVKTFESAFADSQEVAAARAFWMGRAGMYALFRALGVNPGDRVGICSFTCLGVVESVTRLRATPVFLDVDRHMNIAPEALQRLTQPLKVLVLQHTFGVPCQLDTCLDWARQRDIPVVEDCCHALDATWEGRRVGTFGVAGIFAFEWGKPFSAGQGGLVTFNDSALAREVDRVIAAESVRPGRVEAGLLALQRPLYRWLVTPRTRRRLRSLYRWASRRRIITGSQPRSPNLVGQAEGFLKLMSKSQARAACRELQRWPENRRQRAEAAAAIRDRLTTEGFDLIEPDPRAAPVYLRFPVWLRDKQHVLQAAEAARLDLAGWYASPAHPLQGRALTDLGYNPATCPVAEEAFDRVITLPTRPALRPGELDAALRIMRAAR